MSHNYKAFLEDNKKNKKRKNSKKVSIVKVDSNNKTISNRKISIVSIFKGFFKVIVNGVKYFFKIVNDLVEVIAYGFIIIFNRQGNEKQEKFVKQIVSCILAVACCFGVICVKQHKKIKLLESVSITANASNDTTVTSLEVKEDTASSSVENKEVEVTSANNEVVKETKENNNVNDSTKNKKESVSLNQSFDEPVIDFAGTIAFENTVGKVDPAYIGKVKVRYEKGNEIVAEEVASYGLIGFTTVKGKKYVTDFMNYVSKIDNDFYEKYFKDSKVPGTVTFDTGWYTASKTESEKFKNYQFNFIYLAYVKPVVKSIEKTYNIDLMSSKASTEFIFSTATQYGEKGTLTLFEKAKITSDMSEKEIIEKIQQEKIDSLGVYTYTDSWKYDDKYREGVKVRAEKELKQFLELL